MGSERLIDLYPWTEIRINPRTMQYEERKVYGDGRKTEWAPVRRTPLNRS